MIFEILEYEATPKTPHVYFNGNKGILNIEGRCIPEDASKFFEELHSFLDRYQISKLSIKDVCIFRIFQYSFCTGINETF